MRGWPGTLFLMHGCNRAGIAEARTSSTIHFGTLEQQGCMGIDTVVISKFQKCLAVNDGMLCAWCGDGLVY